MIGSGFFGWISDTFGRVMAYRITSVVYLVFAVVMMLSVNIYMVIVCIFFVGACFGGDVMTTGTILTDFLPLSKRWILCFLTITWAFGSILLTLLGLLLNVYDVEAIVIFRVICAFINVWIILSLIMRLFMDESPAYLLSVQKFDKARTVLEKIAKVNSR